MHQILLSRRNILNDTALTVMSDIRHQNNYHKLT